MAESRKHSILVLSSLNPEEREGKLFSPKLNENLVEYDRYESELWTDFSDARPGEINEMSIARKLADYYLLKTAEKLQYHPRDELLWTRRFNQASQEIYGLPDADEAASIAADELDLFEANAPGSYAASIYRKVAKEGRATEKIEQAEDFRGALFDRFESIAEVIGNLGEGPYDSQEVREVFIAILKNLAADDDQWEGWEVCNPGGKTMVSVVAGKKRINVPDGRSPVESKDELLGLVLHEIGVHAQRAANGYKLGDSKLIKGLPNYLSFEEGLATVFETLASGETPNKIKDRYIDTSLALGVFEDVVLTREELIVLGTERERARGSRASDEELAQQIESHVNRIFRGGNGKPIVDQSGEIMDQAVFVKDILYYEGFAKVKEYFKKAVRGGDTPTEIIDYLLSGKFDPTNSLHAAYLKDNHSISL